MLDGSDIAAVLYILAGIVIAAYGARAAAREFVDDAGLGLVMLFVVMLWPVVVFFIFCHTLGKAIHKAVGDG